jgi:hypothetical protein
MKTGKTNATQPGLDCIGCGQTRTAEQAETSSLCTTCRTVVDLLRNSPETITSLARIAGTELTSTVEIHEERELPDVLDGVRYRTTDRERNTWYVSVSELDGNPVEIFASTAFDRDQHLQSRISNLTTITRLISLILRHIFMGERLTLEKTLTQLRRSSRQPNDLPEMLVKILSNYQARSGGNGRSRAKT